MKLLENCFLLQQIILKIHLSITILRIQAQQPGEEEKMQPLYRQITWKLHLSSLNSLKNRYHKTYLYIFSPILSFDWRKHFFSNTASNTGGKPTIKYQHHQKIVVDSFQVEWFLKKYCQNRTNWSSADEPCATKVLYDSLQMYSIFSAIRQKVAKPEYFCSKFCLFFNRALPYTDLFWMGWKSPQTLTTRESRQLMSRYLVLFAHFCMNVKLKINLFYMKDFIVSKASVLTSVPTVKSSKYIFMKNRRPSDHWAFDSLWSIRVEKLHS